MMFVCVIMNREFTVADKSEVGGGIASEASLNWSPVRGVSP